MVLAHNYRYTEPFKDGLRFYNPFKQQPSHKDLDTTKYSQVNIVVVVVVVVIIIINPFKQQPSHKDLDTTKYSQG